MHNLSSFSSYSTQQLMYDALADNIRFDRNTKRYRYKNPNNTSDTPITGTFVSRDDVINIQKNYVQRIKKTFIELAPKIMTGEIGVYKDAAELLKKIHVSEGIIAARGIDNLSQSHLGKIGALLKKQYYQGVDETTGRRYGLKHLFKEVEQGKVSEKMLAHRLKLYTQSGDITGSIVKEDLAVKDGMREERRILGETHQHCSDCLRYEAAGWVRIGSLPPPKVNCICGTNCKCTKIYRKQKDEI